MLTATARFGQIDIPEDEIIDFPGGLPGFESAERFVTIEDEAWAPLIWLQSLDQPELAFLTIPPGLLIRGYQPEISEEARAALAMDESTVPEVLAIVTVPDDLRRMTANLRAPLIINRARRCGRQEIGLSGDYEIRYRLIPESGEPGQAAVGR